jgi:hypothetical protein
MLPEASEADDERKESTEADWMIPPIRRSRSAFGPRAKLLRLSLTSALGLKVLPKGPKVGQHSRNILSK